MGALCKVVLHQMSLGRRGRRQLGGGPIPEVGHEGGGVERAVLKQSSRGMMHKPSWLPRAAELRAASLHAAALVTHLGYWPAHFPSLTFSPQLGSGSVECGCLGDGL